MATERGPVKVPCENEDLPEKENAAGEDSLRARADVYRNQGNEAFKKGDFLNAIHFYTEGIKVNCNDKELKAKLYNNRAIAHFKLGNHQDSLSDAKAATELQPTFLKAIVRGAIACVELKRFKEAITWCDKGLAIEKKNKILLSLRSHSVREVGESSRFSWIQSHLKSVNGFQLEERLTPRGVMTLLVYQEDLRRDSSFITREVVS